MPVTIGEFEIVEPPAAPPAAAAAPPPPAPVLDVQQFQGLQQQWLEQALRTWAH